MKYSTKKITLMAKLNTTQLLYKIKTWVLGKIGNITELIPQQASSQNQLADKAFVNSSIATASATFRGTYNVASDLSLSYNASHAQIEAALTTKMSTLSIAPDNNDYAFVQIPTSQSQTTEIAKTEKYKYNGTTWAFEYELNSSGFTSAQWAAINSGATLELIGKLSALPTNSQLSTLLSAKANRVTVVPQSASSATINPNVLNVWGEIANLAISFAAGVSGEVNEYMIQFSSPSNAGTTITFPNTVKWANNDTLEPEAGYVYQVSVVNNLAVYAGWEAV